MNILIPSAQMRKLWPDPCCRKLTLMLVDRMDWRRPQGGVGGWGALGRGTSTRGLGQGIGLDRRDWKGNEKDLWDLQCPGFCLGGVGWGASQRWGTQRWVVWGSGANILTNTSSWPQTGGRGRITPANSMSWHCCCLWP